MKGVLLLLVTASLIAFSSCSKKKDSTVTNTTPPGADSSLVFTINTYNFNAIIDQYVDTLIEVPITLRYMSGKREPVTIKISNPALWVTADSVMLMPDQSGKFRLKFHPNKEGDFTIKLSTESNSSGKQEVVCNITVKKDEHCNYITFWKYKQITSCSEGYSGIKFSRANHPDTPQLFIGGRSVNAIVNCNSRTIAIPGYYSVDYETSYYGNGYFNNDSIIINWYQEQDNMAPVICKSILVKNEP